MSVALYFVTHEGISSRMLQVACSIIQQQIVDNLDHTEIPMDANVETCTHQAIKDISQLDTNTGLIIITDIYGSTPSNIAQTLVETFHASLISGLNLPMLLRLLNYRNEKLPILINKAIEGGKDGIQQYHETSDGQNI